jgi:hypothetical protein
MKIKVEVDLSDFYKEDDDNESFSDEIKRHIAWTVKHEVIADWEKKMGDEFNKALIAELESAKQEIIINTLKELIEEPDIQNSYYSKEKISIKQWMIESFEREHLKDKRLNELLNKQTSESAKLISEQLKNRHDIIFATNIVKNLSEKGFLKDGIANTLLEEN